MVCSVCGKPIDAGAKFCSNCGSAVATQVPFTEVPYTQAPYTQAPYTQAPPPPSNGGPAYGFPPFASRPRLMRSRTQRMIAGVCGGLAEQYNWDVTIVRLIAVILALAGGTTIVAYIIAWAVMPEAPLAPTAPPYAPPPPASGASAS